MGDHVLLLDPCAIPTFQLRGTLRGERVCTDFRVDPGFPSLGYTQRSRQTGSSMPPCAAATSSGWGADVSTPSRCRLPSAFRDGRPHGRVGHGAAAPCISREATCAATTQAGGAGVSTWALHPPAKWTLYLTGVENPQEAPLLLWSSGLQQAFWLRVPCQMRGLQALSTGKRRGGWAHSPQGQVL